MAKRKGIRKAEQTETIGEDHNLLIMYMAECRSCGAVERDIEKFTGGAYRQILELLIGMGYVATQYAKLVLTPEGWNYYAQLVA